MLLQIIESYFGEEECLARCENWLAWHQNWMYGTRDSHYSFLNIASKHTLLLGFISTPLNLRTFYRSLRNADFLFAQC